VVQFEGKTINLPSCPEATRRFSPKVALAVRDVSPAIPSMPRSPIIAIARITLVYFIFQVV
jgi:hypothetical protein